MLVDVMSPKTQLFHKVTDITDCSCHAEDPDLSLLGVMFLSLTFPWRCFIFPYHLPDAFCFPESYCFYFNYDVLVIMKFYVLKPKNYNISSTNG